VLLHTVYAVKHKLLKGGYSPERSEALTRLKPLQDFAEALHGRALTMELLQNRMKQVAELEASDAGNRRVSGAAFPTFKPSPSKH
jgi:hypothetical protein